MIQFVSGLAADALLAGLAAAGFAAIFNPPLKAVLVSALLAAAGHGFRFVLLKAVPVDLILATFLAALFVGFAGIPFAKLIRCPAEVFSFPSLLPMVPGMYAYKTILSLIGFMKNDNEALLQHMLVEIFRNGFTALGIMSALVVGVSVPLFIFYEQSFMMTRPKNPKNDPAAPE